MQRTHSSIGIADMRSAVSAWIGSNTLRRVEDLTGVSNAYWCQIRSGKRPVTEATAVTLLTAVYGVSVKDAKLVFLNCLRDAITTRINLIQDPEVNKHAL